MQLPELWENLPEPFRTERVLGEPREAGDGTTIIPAITVRGRVGSGGGGDGQDAGHGRGPRFTAAPAGIYVIREGKAQWVPATSSTLLGVLGISCGLAASVLFGIAAIRRAPWPDVRIRVTKPLRAEDLVKRQVDLSGRSRFGLTRQSVQAKSLVQRVNG